MRLFYIFLVLCISYASADYTKQQRDKFLEVAKICYKKLGVPLDSDLFERIMYHLDKAPGEEEQNFIGCTTVAIGWMDTEGKIDTGLVVEFFAENCDRQLVKEVVSSCDAAKTGPTVREKAWSFYKCFFTTKKFDI